MQVNLSLYNGCDPLTQIILYSLSIDLVFSDVFINQNNCHLSVNFFQFKILLNIQDYQTRILVCNKRRIRSI
jgi:hypothetical protein